MKKLVVVMFLAAALPAKEDKSERLPAVSLPHARSPQKAEPTKYPPFIVTISAKGEVFVDPAQIAPLPSHGTDPRDKPPSALDSLARDAFLKTYGPDGVQRVSLNRLARLLAGAVGMIEMFDKADGREAYKKVGGHEFLSRPILIRADKRAPWGHVMWVAVIAVEHRVGLIRIGARTDPAATKPPRSEGVLKLPWPDVDQSLSIEIDEDNAPAHVRVAVKWSKARHTVAVNGALTESTKFKAVLRRALQVRKARLVVLEAAPACPFEHVVTTIDRIRQTDDGLRVWWWLEADLPDGPVRKLSPLPALE